MTEHLHYSYRVFWYDGDGQWVGTCTEFPGLSHLAAEPAEALKGIQDLIENVVEDMHDNGEVVPEPLSSKTYTGKFLVRVPPELHRRLVFEAAEAQVSLNMLVCYRLSAAATDIPVAPVATAPLLKAAAKAKPNQAEKLPAPPKPPGIKHSAPLRKRASRAPKPQKQAA